MTVYGHNLDLNSGHFPFPKIENPQRFDC